jgi:hypothetical protein
MPITSSARTSKEGGTARPSALAVFMLITSSNLVGCSTGRSEGLAPLRILSTVAASAAPRVGYIGAIYDQSAIGELPEEINSRQMMLRRERDNSWGMKAGG